MAKPLTVTCRAGPSPSSGKRAGREDPIVKVPPSGWLQRRRTACALGANTNRSAGPTASSPRLVCPQQPARSCVIAFPCPLAGLFVFLFPERGFALRLHQFEDL